MFLIDSSIKSVVVTNWQTMLQWKNTTDFNTDKNRVLQKFFSKNARNNHCVWASFKSTYLIFYQDYMATQYTGSPRYGTQVVCNKVTEIVNHNCPYLCIQQI